MKQEIRLIKAYGRNDFGLADMPNKISGTAISRIILGNDIGCAFCFPHGFETINSREMKRQRNWKRQRKTQWR